MRVSRMVTKERLRETIDEAMDSAMTTFASEHGETDIITDAVWSLLGELDSEDDFGVALQEEAEENAE